MDDNTLKNLLHSTLLILFPSVLIEILSISKLIFCRVSLYALNQETTKDSSRFTISVSLQIFLCWTKILVSSAKRMKERYLEHENMSFCR